MLFLCADKREGVESSLPSRRSFHFRGVITAAVYATLAFFSVALFAPTLASAKPPKSRKAIVRVETVRLRTAPGKSGKLAALLDAGRVARVLEKRDGWAKLKLASGTTGWVRADLLAINKKKTKDTGAFAAQHPVAESAPRRTRRAKKSESVVAKNTSRKSSHKESTHKLAVKPMVAKAKPQSKPKTIRKPVSVAHVTPQVVRHVVSVPKPVATPDARVEPVLTEDMETATLREGISSQELADVPTRTPDVATADLNEAVPPTQTEMTVSPETIVASAPLPKSKRIKGAVAPAVRVPIERASKRGDRIVTRALTYRGVPYRMGATGRGAFDCSSFTRYILRQSGESLPRTAAEQYRKGTPVTKDEMRSGDLVFFKNTYKHGVSHVGIYMGDGKFVHASSHGGVKTSSLNEAYYIHHWAGARRPNITQGWD